MGRGLAFSPMDFFFDRTPPERVGEGTAIVQMILSPSCCGQGNNTFAAHKRCAVYLTDRCKKMLTETKYRTILCLVHMLFFNHFIGNRVEKRKIYYTYLIEGCFFNIFYKNNTTTCSSNLLNLKLIFEKIPLFYIRSVTFVDENMRFF